MNIFLSAHPTTATPFEIFVVLFFCVGVFILYLLRKLPLLNDLWFYIRTFLCILIANFAWGFFKDKISKK
jgi:hypothetical protein